MHIFKEILEIEYSAYSVFLFEFSELTVSSPITSTSGRDLSTGYNL